MQPYERKQLLERIERDGATVGTQIPDEVTVDGEPVELRAFVFEAQSRETYPAAERDRVERVHRKLRGERARRADRLESAALSYEDGKALADAIVALDRALNALDQLEPVDLTAQERRQRTADRKRWLSFLDDALGNDETGGVDPRP